jgi:nicotinamidase-related amidase
VRGRAICIEDTEGVLPLAEATDTTDEEVFLKSAYDGFSNPELDSHLQQNEKRFVLVAGLVTSVCVLQTVASAVNRGYLSAVVNDCCADQEFIHDAILKRYEFAFDQQPLHALSEKRADWAEQIRQASAPLRSRC